MERFSQGPVSQRPSHVGKCHLSLEQRWFLPPGDLGPVIAPGMAGDSQVIPGEVAGGYLPIGTWDEMTRDWARGSILREVPTYLYNDMAGRDALRAIPQLWAPGLVDPGPMIDLEHKSHSCPEPQSWASHLSGRFVGSLTPSGAVRFDPGGQ